jgi:hypothetical protein
MNIDDLIQSLVKLREEVGANAGTNVTGVSLISQRDWDIMDITVWVHRDSV